MTKKSKKAAATRKEASKDVEVERAAEKQAGFDPIERLHLTDWFERWPEIFARRWPESFQDNPFIGAGFRMEQLVEDDGTMVVRGELPGLDPETDVTVTIDNDRLTIAGEREERTEETDRGTRRSEFRYGSFQRSVSLPSGARRDAIVASYDQGILEVRIPVESDEESVTTIPVTSAEG